MERTTKERESIDYQLREWVAGRPHHNKVLNECCPDFSCCIPELLVDSSTRQEFASASPAKKSSMLMSFLGSMLRVTLGDDNVQSMVSGYAVKAGSENGN